jgi:hypothetical protein
MQEEANKSEVARLMRQIATELEAAERGLRGLAFGTARHDFINAKLDRAGAYKEQLAKLVGEEQATALLYQQYVETIG